METTTAEPMPAMKVEPQREHRWLQKFVGEWTFEGEAMMEPGKPSWKFEGTESVRSIGDVWIVGEGQSPMPDGGPATTMMTIGYDMLKKRFVGAFIGSMMTYLWVYEGELDPSEKVLTLNTEGPNMAAEGKIAKFQDVTEFVSDDHRVFRSRILGDDGAWHEIMRMDFWRKS